MTRAETVSRTANNTSLAQAAKDREGSALHRPARYGRWRAGTLLLVYCLMGLHLAHWKIAGRTLAPLELNEVMHTLELGIVTAGFVFMSAAMLSVFIFGRFFCSWGCHILALEDLCAWLLRKIGIRPKPLRSRVLLLVPPAALFYMFIWPQINRLLHGRDLPAMRLTTDVDGWASFLTTDFARNLPGPWVAVITFVVCGFIAVYVLGSRGFCIYACPYGAAFAIADRFAPGRIRLKGDCAQCAKCTAACNSRVRVHEEIDKYGMVVDSACLKDLDCVSVCPQNAISFGFGKPSITRTWGRGGALPIAYDFTRAEDALMAVVFVAALLIFRGLYGVVPFLMTLAVGGILAYTSVVFLRLRMNGTVRLNNLVLKKAGGLTMQGKAFAALGLLLGACMVHSAFVRYHEYRGQRAFDAFAHAAAAGGDTEQTAANALHHLRFTERWGLLRHPQNDQRHSALLLAGKSPGDAEFYIRRVLTRSPEDRTARLSLGRMLIRLDRPDEATAELRHVAGSPSGGDQDNQRAQWVRADARRMLAELHQSRGAITEAVAEYSKALDERPNSIAAHMGLGELLANLGRLPEAESHFRAVLETRPEMAEAHYNLGVMLAAQGRADEATTHYRSAVRIRPRDADAQNNLGFELARAGNLDEAQQHLQLAIAANPNHADAHFNLGRVLGGRGSEQEAMIHFRKAARLNANYAKILGVTAEPGDG